MATVIIPCDIVVRTIGRGSENADQVYRALKKKEVECTVPFGPLPDAKYLLAITHIPSVDLETLLKECMVERV